MGEGGSAAPTPAPGDLRRGRIREVMDAYYWEEADSRGRALSRLLADLMHWAEAETGVRWGDSLPEAVRLYRHEAGLPFARPQPPTEGAPL